MNDVVVDLSHRPVAAGDAEIQPQEDGTVIIDFEPRKAPTDARVDPENLAEQLDGNALNQIALKVVEMVDADEASRAEWFARFQDGLKKCGAIPVTVTPSFAGESTCVHPLIMEAAAQFQARAIEEIFPSTGPVKAQVLGEETEEIREQAERVQRHMNYQVTCEDEEYFWDTDQMLFILPFAGSAFKKSYKDPELGIVVSRFIPVEDVILPYNWRGHIKRSPRTTHRFKLSHNDFLARQASGFYLSPEALSIPMPTAEGDTETTAVKADGVSPSSLEEDREHTMLEMHVKWVLPGIDDTATYPGGAKRKQIARPYILTVEKEAQRVVSIRKNWKRQKPGADEKAQVVPRCWFTHYKYLPGFGSLGYGLLHAIGGLGEAATEALQEMLHSAKYASRQGGFKAKDARLPQKNMRIPPGVYLDTEMTSEELNKAFYTPNFKEPSTAHFNLLGFLVEAGQRFAATTDAMVGGGGENTPVGTTIARIEQGSKVYSAIHKRIHKAAGEEFKLRAELNCEYLQREGTGYTVKGQAFEIRPEDYDDRIDIEPVSDPNIVSTPQRIALAEAQVQRAMAKPQLYDAYEVERRFLEALKVPEIDQVLIKPGEVPPCDAVTEGQLAITGRPIRAFAEQDHPSHIVVHQGQLMMLAGSPVEKQVAPVLLAHIAEHMAHAYRLQMSAQLGGALPEPPLDQRKQAPMPPEMDAQISQGAAMVVQQQMAAMQKQMAAEAAGTTPSQVEEQARLTTDEQQQRVRKATLEADKIQRELDGIGDEIAAELREQFGAEIQRIGDEARAAVEVAQAEAQAAREEAAKAVANFNTKLSEGESRSATEREKAEITANAKVEVERVKAEAARASERLEGQIADLKRQVQELGAAVKEAAKAKPASAEKPAEPAPIHVTVPVTIVKEAAGPKTFTLKGPDGKTVTGEVKPEKPKKE